MPSLRSIPSLTKFKICMLVALTGYAGYVLNGGGLMDWEAFLIGTLILISAAGSGAVNQALEVEEDAKMKRTLHRPIVNGEWSKQQAMLFGGGLTVLSSTGMLVLLNSKVAFLSLLTFILYNFIYTPLKKITPFAIVFGTLPGALPVLGGGLAANPNQISGQVILLFLILIVWQVPHFIGLSVCFEEDYEQAGFKIGYSVKNVPFFNFLLAISLPALAFLSIKLILFKPNMFGFFLTIFSLISSVVSSLYMIKKVSKDNGLNVVKNFSLYLITLIVSTVLA